jgi:hypothetical protein
MPKKHFAPVKKKSLKAAIADRHSAKEATVLSAVQDLTDLKSQHLKDVKAVSGHASLKSERMVMTADHLKENLLALIALAINHALSGRVPVGFLNRQVGFKEEIRSFGQRRF